MRGVHRPPRSAGRAKTSQADPPLDQIREFFHLPVEEASERLGVNKSKLKRLCRENEISRWPQRKLQSLVALRQHIQNDDRLLQQDRQAMLSRLELQWAEVLADPDKPLEREFEDMRKNLYKVRYQKRKQQRLSSGSGLWVGEEGEEGEPEDDDDEGEEEEEDDEEGGAAQGIPGTTAAAAAAAAAAAGGAANPRGRRRRSADVPSRETSVAEAVEGATAGPARRRRRQPGLSRPSLQGAAQRRQRGGQLAAAQQQQQRVRRRRRRARAGSDRSSGSSSSSSAFEGGREEEEVVQGAGEGGAGAAAAASGRRHRRANSDEGRRAARATRGRPRAAGSEHGSRSSSRHGSGGDGGDGGGGGPQNSSAAGGSTGRSLEADIRRRQQHKLQQRVSSGSAQHGAVASAARGAGAAASGGRGHIGGRDQQQQRDESRSSLLGSGPSSPPAGTGTGAAVEPRRLRLKLRAPGLPTALFDPLGGQTPSHQQRAATTVTAMEKEQSELPPPPPHLQLLGPQSSQPAQYPLPLQPHQQQRERQEQLQGEDWLYGSGGLPLQMQRLFEEAQTDAAAALLDPGMYGMSQYGSAEYTDASPADLPASFTAQQRMSMNPAANSPGGAGTSSAPPDFAAAAVAGRARAQTWQGEQHLPPALQPLSQPDERGSGPGGGPDQGMRPPEEHGPTAAAAQWARVTPQQQPGDWWHQQQLLGMQRSQQCLQPSEWQQRVQPPQQRHWLQHSAPGALEPPAARFASQPSSAHWPYGGAPPQQRLFEQTLQQQPLHPQQTSPPPPPQLPEPQQQQQQQQPGYDQRLHPTALPPRPLYELPFGRQLAQLPPTNQMPQSVSGFGDMESPGGDRDVGGGFGDAAPAADSAASQLQLPMPAPPRHRSRPSLQHEYFESPPPVQQLQQLPLPHGGLPQHLLLQQQQMHMQWRAMQQMQQMQLRPPRMPPDLHNPTPSTRPSSMSMPPRHSSMPPAAPFPHPSAVAAPGFVQMASTAAYTFSSAANAAAMAVPAPTAAARSAADSAAIGGLYGDPGLYAWTSTPASDPEGRTRVVSSGVPQGPGFGAARNLPGPGLGPVATGFPPPGHSIAAPPPRAPPTATGAPSFAQPGPFSPPHTPLASHLQQQQQHHQHQQQQHQAQLRHEFDPQPQPSPGGLLPGRLLGSSSGAPTPATAMSSFAATQWGPPSAAGDAVESRRQYALSQRLQQQQQAAAAQAAHQAQARQLYQQQQQQRLQPPPHPQQAHPQMMMLERQRRLAAERRHMEEAAALGLGLGSAAAVSTAFFGQQQPPRGAPHSGAPSQAYYTSLGYPPYAAPTDRPTYPASSPLERSRSGQEGGVVEAAGGAQHQGAGAGGPGGGGGGLEGAAAHLGGQGQARQWQMQPQPQPPPAQQLPQEEAAAAQHQQQLSRRERALLALRSLEPPRRPDPVPQQHQEHPRQQPQQRTHLHAAQQTFRAPPSVLEDAAAPTQTPFTGQAAAAVGSQQQHQQQQQQRALLSMAPGLPPHEQAAARTPISALGRAAAGGSLDLRTRAASHTGSNSGAEMMSLAPELVGPAPVAAEAAAAAGGINAVAGAVGVEAATLNAGGGAATTAARPDDVDGTVVRVSEHVGTTAALLSSRRIASTAASLGELVAAPSGGAGSEAEPGMAATAAATAAAMGAVESHVESGVATVPIPDQSRPSPLQTRPVSISATNQSQAGPGPAAEQLQPPRGASGSPISLKLLYDTWSGSPLDPSARELAQNVRAPAPGSGSAHAASGGSAAGPSAGAQQRPVAAHLSPWQRLGSSGGGGMPTHGSFSDMLAAFGEAEAQAAASGSVLDAAAIHGRGPPSPPPPPLPPPASPPPPSQQQHPQPDSPGSVQRWSLPVPSLSTARQLSQGRHDGSPSGSSSGEVTLGSAVPAAASPGTTAASHPPPPPGPMGAPGLLQPPPSPPLPHPQQNLQLQPPQPHIQPSPLQPQPPSTSGHVAATAAAAAAGAAAEPQDDPATAASAPSPTVGPAAPPRPPLFRMTFGSGAGGPAGGFQMQLHPPPPPPPPPPEQ